MLKPLLQTIGRKKNPAFTIDPSVSGGVIAMFIWRKAIAWIRHMRIMACGKKPGLLFLGKGVKISGIRSFHFGKLVQIGDYVSITAYGKKGLTICDNVWIGSNSYIKVSFSFNDPGEYIYIGSNVGIGEFAHLGGAGGLTIGNDCIIGPYLSCHPENHNFFDNELPIRMQGVTRRGINIGNNCWIGAKVTILDGVTIGNNCVIAAGAVVTKNMPANSIIGGVPAKVIRSRMKIAGKECINQSIEANLNAIA
jgi:acetyltransferase-like isoleucine patch superfamily enzyme